LDNSIAEIPAIGLALFAHQLLFLPGLLLRAICGSFYFSPSLALHFP